MLKRNLVIALLTLGSAGFALDASGQDNGLQIRAGLLGTTRGVFDAGIHRFSEESYLPSVTARLTIMPTPLMGVDVSYSFGESGSTLSSGSSLLSSHIIDAGIRVNSPWTLGGGTLMPYARAGGSLWMVRAHFKDYSRYDDWASNFGIYGAGGIYLGTTLRDTFGAAYPDTGVGLTLEVGHTQSLKRLEFDPFGDLNTSGLFYSLGLELSF